MFEKLIEQFSNTYPDVIVVGLAVYAYRMLNQKDVNTSLKQAEVIADRVADSFFKKTMEITKKNNEQNLKTLNKLLKLSQKQMLISQDFNDLIKKNNEFLDFLKNIFK
jgi:hypothetical protein